ncbi:MAG: hypothetical protein FJ218_07325, partial [Ignavibacteria bacterium]|nr:hypothetical protein [Ignavibacteria bacterium]
HQGKNSREFLRDGVAESVVRYLSSEQKKDLLEELETEMKRAAKELEFERAAQLRDEIARLKMLNKKT